MVNKFIVDDGIQEFAEKEQRLEEEQKLEDVKLQAKLDKIHNEMWKIPGGIRQIDIQFVCTREET